MDETGNTEDHPENDEQNEPSLDGRFRLKVSHDSLTAHLFQLTAPIGHGRPVALEDVMLKLKKSKITYGINHDLIKTTLEGVAQGTIPEEPVLIAHGKEVKHGDDAKLEWLIDPKNEDITSRIVLPEQVLANLSPSTKGEAGMDIYSKPIRARAGIQLSINTGEGVSSHMAGELHEYRADHFGILDYDDDRLSVNIPDLAITEDGLEAKITVYGFAGKRENKISSEHVIQALNSLKIVFGIDEEALARALQQAQASESGFVENVLVAKGIPAIHGSDAALNWFTDPDTEKERDRVVVAEQPVAKFTPATKGKNGKDIYGKEIKAEPGAELSFAQGSGLELKETEKEIDILATVHGTVQLVQGKLNVVPIPVKVSKDALTATMDIYAKSSGQYSTHIKSSDITDVLTRSKIIHGVSEENINRLILEAKASESGALKQATVAEGTPAKDGEDGSVEWHIDTKTENEHEHLVIPRQTIAIKHLATKGDDGKDVYGKAIHPTAGRDPSLMKSSGISSKPENNTEIFYADMLGFVEFTKGVLSLHVPPVKISPDRLSVMMDVYATSGGKTKQNITPEHIINVLKKSRLSHGFEETVLAGLIGQASQAKNGVLKQATVASGSPAVDGDDCQIKWHVKIDSDDKADRIVLPGQNIATRTALTKGIAGKDVYGKPIRPVAGKDRKLIKGDYVNTTHVENRDEYYAAEYGVATFSEDKLSVTLPGLLIAADGLSAKLNIYAKCAGENRRLVETPHVTSILQKAGIVFGIDTDAIEAALNEMNAGKTRDAPVMKTVVVAKGQDKKNGVPAKLHIDHNIAPGKRLANGTIDLHERDYPWDIKKGVTLGTFTAAVMAVDGKKVTGEPIQAEQVDNIQVVLEGIRMEKDGTLVSDVAGTLLVDNFDLKVTDCLVINSDIDINTGNIHTRSSVQITGFVTAGFVVEAMGDIIIKQNVEDAVVRCGGNVIIHGGIRGPRSEIFAAHNIKAGFAEYGRLIAKNDIEIERSSIDAHLVAGNDIKVGPSPGTIIAGKCEAVHQVWVNNIGHAASGMSHFQLGLTHKKLLRILHLEEKEEPLTPQEKKELKLLTELAERSKTAALRVKGKIESDAELQIGLAIHKIQGDVSFHDFYLDPDTRKITFRAYDEKSAIPSSAKVKQTLDTGENKTG